MMTTLRLDSHFPYAGTMARSLWTTGGGPAASSKGRGMSKDDADVTPFGDLVRRAEAELRAEARARESDIADGPRRGPKVGRGAFGLYTLAARYELSDNNY